MGSVLWLQQQHKCISLDPNIKVELCISYIWIQYKAKVSMGGFFVGFLGFFFMVSGSLLDFLQSDVTAAGLKEVYK